MTGPGTWYLTEDGQAQLTTAISELIEEPEAEA